MQRILTFTMLMLLSTGVAMAETSINRIAVGTGIEEREPVEVNNLFHNDTERLYCFTEIATDQAPTSIVHVWTYQGRTMAEVPLRVGSARWRTYSSKKIVKQWTGEWKIEVFSDDGALLGATEFILLEKN